MMKRLITICIAVALLSNIAVANLSFICGEESGEGSWEQRFFENGLWNSEYHNFDLLGIQVISGPPLENPAMNDFSISSGWHIAYENPPSLPTLASSVGPAVDYLQWDFWFSGTKYQPFLLYYAAFAGETLLGTQGISYSDDYGGSWTYLAVNSNWQPTRDYFVHTPAPGAVLLGGIGVGLVGWLRRRRYL